MSNIQTTGTGSNLNALTEEMQTYYEKVFLARSEYELVYEEGAQKRAQSTGNGKVLRFNRYTPLALITSALAEGSNPAFVDVDGENVDVTLAEYGSAIKISRFLTLTSIDVNNKEKIELLGQNMRESIDQLVRTELFTGATVQLASGKSALSDLAVSDVLDADEIRKAVRTLETNKARPYKDGFFLGKVQPYTKYDFTRDTTWVNAKTYSDTRDLYRGEMGELLQVRMLLSKNGKSESSTVTAYSNFIHGRDAFGTFDLESDQPKLYIVPHTKIDSGNYAGRFSIASWAGTYAVKTLQPLWLINIKTGATA